MDNAYSWDISTFSIFIPAMVLYSEGDDCTVLCFVPAGQSGARQHNALCRPDNYIPTSLLLCSFAVLIRRVDAHFRSPHLPATSCTLFPPSSRFLPFHHLSIQVREEQTRLRPDLDALVTGDVLNEMTFTRQVVKEILRYRPPAPMVPQVRWKVAFVWWEAAEGFVVMVQRKGNGRQISKR